MAAWAHDDSALRQVGPPSHSFVVAVARFASQLKVQLKCWVREIERDTAAHAIETSTRLRGCAAAMGRPILAELRS